MRPVDGELLRLLADMPFLDRLDMVAVSGWSRGGVYRAVPRLEDAGLIASVPHGTELVTPTRRFHLTAAGLRRLAHARNASLEDLLRDLPVSARWRRVLLERLDAVAVVYRLASAISNAAYPIRFRWYRAMPMDAAIELSDGRTIAIVRQGPTTDRTGFSKRLWRLTQGRSPEPSCCSPPTRCGCATPAGGSPRPPPRRSSPWSGRRPQRPRTTPCGGCAPSTPPSACGPS